MGEAITNIKTNTAVANKHNLKGADGSSKARVERNPNPELNNSFMKGLKSTKVSGGSSGKTTSPTTDTGTGGNSVTGRSSAPSSASIAASGKTGTGSTAIGRGHWSSDAVATKRERSPRGNVLQGAASCLPQSFFENAGITPDEFNRCFVHLDKGIFQLRSGSRPLAFTHAVLTTGDRPTNLVTGKSGSAGELWRDSTGDSMRNDQCCVNNCPNPNCSPTSPQPAGATAHVYDTFQLSHHDIGFMILLPTCTFCNNWFTCIRTETNYPKAGQNANVLYTVDSANRIVRVMFVEANSKTTTRKGDAGKGTGKGGNCYDKGGNGGSNPKGGAPYGSNFV